MPLKNMEQGTVLIQVNDVAQGLVYVVCPIV